VPGHAVDRKLAPAPDLKKGNAVAFFGRRKATVPNMISVKRWPDFAPAKERLGQL
jgi:hypothetical protein